MKDFFEDKEKRIPGNMEYDIEQIRNELGKDSRETELRSSVC